MSSNSSKSLLKSEDVLDEVMRALCDSSDKSEKLTGTMLIKREDKTHSDQRLLECDAYLQRKAKDLDKLRRLVGRRMRAADNDQGQDCGDEHEVASEEKPLISGCKLSDGQRPFCEHDNTFIDPSVLAYHAINAHEALCCFHETRVIFFMSRRAHAEHMWDMHKVVVEGQCEYCEFSAISRNEKLDFAAAYGPMMEKLKAHELAEHAKCRSSSSEQKAPDTERPQPTQAHDSNLPVVPDAGIKARELGDKESTATAFPTTASQEGAVHSSSGATKPLSLEATPFEPRSSPSKQPLDWLDLLFGPPDALSPFDRILGSMSYYGRENGRYGTPAPDTDSTIRHYDSNIRTIHDYHTKSAPTASHGYVPNAPGIIPCGSTDLFSPEWNASSLSSESTDTPDSSAAEPDDPFSSFPDKPPPRERPVDVKSLLDFAGKKPWSNVPGDFNIKKASPVKPEDSPLRRAIEINQPRECGREIDEDLNQWRSSKRQTAPMQSMRRWRGNNKQGGRAGALADWGRDARHYDNRNDSNEYQEWQDRLAEGIATSDVGPTVAGFARKKGRGNGKTKGAFDPDVRNGSNGADAPSSYASARFVQPLGSFAGQKRQSATNAFDEYAPATNALDEYAPATNALDEYAPATNALDEYAPATNAAGARRVAGMYAPWDEYPPQPTPSGGW